MRNLCSKAFFSGQIICAIVAIMIIISCTIAKSNPNPQNARALAFKRAKSLDNGISVSALEQTWNNRLLDNDILKNSDLDLLKKLGFKSIRLPVAFTYFEANNIPYEQVFTRIDKAVEQCKSYGFKLVIDYHYGTLNDANYLTETPKIVNTWLKLAKRYGNQSADDLFFELYNEPPHMDPKIWKDAAYNIATAIRKVDAKRTLIIGASNFNSIYELSRFVRLGDENIIYTFHFYEPFFFTHQGADWVGAQSATTGVPFPYSAENFPALNPTTKNTWGETNYYQYKRDGNEQSVKDKLLIVKKWGDKYFVPVICGEYGVYNKYTDQASRCRYIKAVRKYLKAYKIPGMLWDYNTNFSIFNGEPGIDSLPDCMKDAIGYIPKK
jgi:endoglucanase